MHVLIGHPLLMECKGTVYYKRETKKVNELEGMLLDFALACALPEVKHVKVNFGINNTIMNVELLGDDGIYQSWNPSRDKELALSLLAEETLSKNLSEEDIKTMLRNIVAKAEGDIFVYDRPVNNDR